MHPQERALSTKNLAAIALFAAFYILTTAVTGIVLPVLRGYPAHFFRGLSMSACAAFSRARWSVSVMSVISGLVFLAVVPAPAPYLLFSTVGAGVVYDLCMGRAYQQSARRFGRITVGTLLSGLVEGVIAMAVLTYVGLFNVRPELLAVIWVGAIAANMVLSTIGAQVTVLLLRRYRK